MRNFRSRRKGFLATRLTILGFWKCGLKSNLAKGALTVTYDILGTTDKKRLDHYGIRADQKATLGSIGAYQTPSAKNRPRGLRRGRAVIPNGAQRGNGIR